MKAIIIFLMSSLFFVSSTVFSQTEIESSIYKGKSTIFMEYAGLSSTAVSLQYDHVFFVKEKYFFNYSVGFGLGHPVSFFDEKRLSIPLSINYSTGLKDHHFELGTGLVYLNTDEKTGVLAGLRLGYKYQSNHLYFRVSSALTNYILVFEEEPQQGLDFGDLDLINNLLGISVGYSF